MTGLALWFIKNKRGVKRDGDLSIKDAIIVGRAHCVALMPGVSRSGAARREARRLPEPYRPTVLRRGSGEQCEPWRSSTYLPRTAAVHFRLY
ncbi:undecaprenyl-diphosphate phosphatase, partial [Micrococcus sp. SIMBA_144]